MSGAHLQHKRMSWDDSIPTSSGSDCEGAPAHLQLHHSKTKKRMRTEHDHASVPEKKGSWSESEELELIKRHREIGNKWATISKFLPGRSDNGVKNHWNSTLRSKSASRHETFLWIYAKQVEPVAECKESRHAVFKKAKAEYMAILEQMGPASGEESSREPDGLPFCSATMGMQQPQQLVEWRATRNSVSFCQRAEPSLCKPPLAGSSRSLTALPYSKASDEPRPLSLGRLQGLEDGSLSDEGMRYLPASSSSHKAAAAGAELAAEEGDGAAAADPFSSFIFMGPPSAAPLSVKSEPGSLKGPEGMDALGALIPEVKDCDLSDAALTNFSDIYNAWGSEEGFQHMMPLSVNTSMVPSGLVANGARAEGGEGGSQSPGSGRSEMDCCRFTEPRLSSGASLYAFVDAPAAQEEVAEEDGVDPLLIAPEALDGVPRGVLRTNSFLDAHMLVEDLMDPAPSSSGGTDPLTLCRPGVKVPSDAHMLAEDLMHPAPFPSGGTDPLTLCFSVVSLLQIVAVLAL